MKTFVPVVLFTAALLFLAGCGGNSNTGAHLYAVNSSGSINTFNIEGDASLATASTFSTGGTAAALVLVTAGGSAPSGVKYFAYVVNQGQGQINIYDVDQNGTFTTSASAAVQDGNAPTSLTLGDDGLYLYTADSGSTGTPGISAFTINTTTGALTLAGETPLSFPPSHLVSSGAFVYASIPPSGIEAFSINTSTGALTELAAALQAVVNAGTRPSYLAISGGFLLSADNATSAVYVFQINSSQGNLLAAPGSPANVGLNPASIAVDSASHVFVANQGANNIAVLAIDGSGQLTPVTGSPFATKGQGPVAVALSPGGNALYVADNTTNNIDEFQVANTNNVLTMTAYTANPISSGGSNPVWLLVQ